MSCRQKVLEKYEVANRINRVLVTKDELYRVERIVTAGLSLQSFLMAKLLKNKEFLEILKVKS